MKSSKLVSREGHRGPKILEFAIRVDDLLDISISTRFLRWFATISYLIDWRYSYSSPAQCLLDIETPRSILLISISSIKIENLPSTLIPDKTSRMVNPIINFLRATMAPELSIRQRQITSRRQPEIPRHWVLTVVGTAHLRRNGTRWNWLLLGQWVIEVEYCCLVRLLLPR